MCVAGIVAILNSAMDPLVDDTPFRPNEAQLGPSEEWEGILEGRGSARGNCRGRGSGTRGRLLFSPPIQCIPNLTLHVVQLTLSSDELYSFDYLPFSTVSIE